MVQSCARGGLDWIAGKSSLLEGWSHIEIPPGKWWNSLGVFQRCMEVALGDVVWSWTWWCWLGLNLRGSLSLRNSVILWLSQPRALTRSLHIWACCRACWSREPEQLSREELSRGNIMPAHIPEPGVLPWDVCITPAVQCLWMTVV